MTFSEPVPEMKGCGHASCKIKVGDLIVHCQHAFDKDNVIHISSTEEVRIVCMQILHREMPFMADGACVQAKGIALCPRCFDMRHKVNVPLPVLITGWQPWDPKIEFTPVCDA